MDALAQVRLVLVDSHELIRVALGQLLTAAGANVVGETRSGDEGVRKVLKLRPDVVLVETALADTSGVETIRKLSTLAPDSRILVLTDSHDPSRAVEAILAGACGYMLKSAPPEQIVGAVRASAAGDCVISPQVAGELVNRLREREVPLPARNENAATAIRAVLTERELEVFKRLASGESNQEIGRELSLSENTVKNHIRSILKKLQLNNRVQAAVQAVRAGISIALVTQIALPAEPFIQAF
jgi:DNA-binding NarL/FixJ family response regulator